MLDLTEQSLTRQYDLITSESRETPITVIGAGAVGSWTTLALVKMGYHNITVWDDDTVEIENLGSQMYRIEDIKKPKVEALLDMVESYTGHRINICNQRFDSRSKLLTPIVISAVDSMEVRKIIFDACTGRVNAVIDPRMGAEVAHLYVMNPNDIEDMASYIKAWYSDDDSVREECTSKATIYCANILAGLVAKAVKNLTNKQKYTRVLKYDMKHDHYESYPKQEAI